MPFLFPRRCIRTRLEFLAKKSRTWRRRDRLVAGKHLQLTYAREEHVRLLRFSSPRRDASSISSLCPPRFFRRELAPASIVRNSRRETARNGDSISPALRPDPSNFDFPLFSPLHSGEFARAEEKGIEGERGKTVLQRFFRKKLCFER